MFQSQTTALPRRLKVTIQQPFLKVRVGYSSWKTVQETLAYLGAYTKIGLETFSVLRHGRGGGVFYTCLGRGFVLGSVHHWNVAEWEINC
jgi:hypothetical protein